MKEHNRRQLQNMLDQLVAYEAGKADLAGLISNLESLLNAVEGMPGHWVDRIWQQWGVLEEVYSVAVVREQPVGSIENRRLIGEAIVKIRELVNSAFTDTKAD